MAGRRKQLWEVLILLLHAASGLVEAVHSVIFFLLLLSEDGLDHLDLACVIRALVSKFAE